VPQSCLRWTSANGRAVVGGGGGGPNVVGGGPKTPATSAMGHIDLAQLFHLEKGVW
jgi:hypothetical protein